MEIFIIIFTLHNDIPHGKQGMVADRGWSIHNKTRSVSLFIAKCPIPI